MPPKKRGGARALFRGRQQHGAEKPAEYKPRVHYPTTSTPKLVSLRKSERSQVEYFRRLRKAFQDGPLYTVLDHPGTTTTSTTRTATRPGELPGLRNTAQLSTIGTAQGVGAGAKDVDPFEALPTFSQKFKKPRRPVPQLKTEDYVRSLFPTELHQYIDSTVAPHTTVGNKARAKLTAAEEEELLEEEDEAMMEEEDDDDFEEDEDDDDDYNAENYFSDGKSDAGGDEGGGGDDY